MEQVVTRGNLGGVEDDEDALRRAALEKLPTYHRLRTGILRSVVAAGEAGGGRRQYQHEEVDVRKLGVNQRREFIERVFKVAEEDNERFLSKLRSRIDKVNIQLPTVEVRFEHLNVEAKCHVGNRALPTLTNTIRDIAELALGLLGINLTRKTTLTVLKDISGIIKPSRMVLLLGPPSSGKTTLLRALSGRLDPILKTTGEITYNGYRLDEFVPQKTAAYISQDDVHVGEMTVKETLDFSARCQGVGARYDLLLELLRREKDAGIFPEADVDLFMKATSIEGVKGNLQTDYILKILGLDVCAETIVGDDMQRGISGGQKKRLTTGEMIVGPTKVFFMDEISTGLDSSTTFQIIKCLQQIVHLGEATILMSLLQPAPEIFELFDDIILLCDGQIVYQGPCNHVLNFFVSCGFHCPKRKGTADFLQEVTSRKDQAQYWMDKHKPYRYVTIPEFVQRFQRFHVGLHLANELSIPFDKACNHKVALVFSNKSVSCLHLLKASFYKEWLLIKRNSVVYISKTVMIVIMGLIASTVWVKPRMHFRNEDDGVIYIGALLFGLIVNIFNGYAELSISIERLPVYYKHKDLLFYPAWVFTLPNFLLRIPISILETIVWTSITYYTIGYSPAASRFFKQLLVIFLIQQMAAGLFKSIAGLCRSMMIANTGGALTVLIMFVLGGFILPKNTIPKWWIWGYWVSPLTYAYNALAVNEFLAPRWMDKLASNGKPLGISILENANVFAEDRWYWIGVAGLLGFIILFNVLSTLCLMFLNPIGKPRAIISEERVRDQDKIQDLPRIKRMDYKSEVLMMRMDPSAINEFNHEMCINSATGVAPMRGMILPFTPLSMSFDEVSYFVDMPPEMKDQGITEDRLQLLRNVTGFFIPGVLTALMGVSGAGKTTLMDVLAGRKTSGYVQGDIRISGYPKKQETFTRISGYCEQNDIHSPQLTVQESLIFSAFLRLPQEISDEQKMKFVDEVMDLVELGNLKDAIVGLPGVTGLSREQRKRLTIAVELVANPSIIFMDEPTSGLDARAAAIVMRTVRNTVDTGRTVVCTIHQPSINIFETFDELLLMKRGGQLIYAGPLGRNSHKIIEYFEAIPGIPKMQEKYNPATWMLEVSSVASEERLGMDLAEYYRSSDLFRRNKALVSELSKPAAGTSDLFFPTQHSQSTWGQFRACLWKQWLTYWRSPDYNLVRFFFTLITALLLGSIFWRIGLKRGSSNNLRIVIGAMYAAVMFVGVNNSGTVQPLVATERTVFYRERSAGIYSALPYALSQVLVEIPYVLVQALYYSIIIYSMMSFQWTVAKFFWFYFISFFSFLYFTYYGMMAVSLSPNQQVAAVLAATFYSLFNLFSGFLIPRPRIPKWWLWYYWICPLQWTVYGLIVTQYGDVERYITVPDQPDQRTKNYVKVYYGYDADFMPVVAVVLVGFALFFAFMFAFCIKMLNFQQR
ncbi:ABC transporter G family member 42-like isoform X1 [Zingiber officinale]|uniref:ABC transporter G family member 42-like isoform X1 n=2 Tax=Zingiber officinale TaxID=94328 RepID=UPI001C4BF552|nr:ABC transporter G family member 42-like isoform X1 [Zingiber officinale]